MSEPKRVLPRESVQTFRRWRPEAIAASAPPRSAGSPAAGDPGPGDAPPRAGAAAPRDSLVDLPACAPAGAAGAGDPTRDAKAAIAQPDWPTAAELEALRETAREEGFREGIVQAQAQAAALAGIVESLRGDAARLEAELAAKVLDLTVDIAREVVRGTLAVTPEALLPVIHEALAVLPQTLHHVTLHMHPDDAAMVTRHLQDHPLVHPVRVRANPAITVGGCRITANEADLDATLETRWERVIAKLGRSDAWSAASNAATAGATGGYGGGGD